MKHKNKINNSLIFTLTALVGITAAVLIHQNTWFEFEPTQAAIEHIGEQLFHTGGAAPDSAADIGISDLGMAVNVWPYYDNIAFRRFDKYGTALDVSEVSVRAAVADTPTSPVVAVDRDGNFVVAWSGDPSIGDFNIYVRAYTANGTATGAEQIVNTTTPNNQTLPSIAMDYDGPDTAARFVVAWTSDNGTDTDIKYRRFDVNFSTPAAPTAVDALEQIANTYTTNDQKNSAVGMNNLGEFMVAWFGDNGSGNRVMYQIYAQNGTAIGSNIEVHTPTSLTNIFPSVATDKKYRTTLDDTADIRFIIAYEADISVTEDGIGAKRISCTDPNDTNTDDTDLSCALSGPELIVSSDLTGTEVNPDIAADYLGNFTVVWEDSAIDGTGTGIAGQSFNFKGHHINTNFQVNTTYTAASESVPAIAMNTEGFYDTNFYSLGTATGYFNTYITEIFKVDNEYMPHVTAALVQGDVATDISPTNNQVFTWKDYSDNSIRFSLYEIDQSTPSAPVSQLVNNGADVINIKVDSASSTNVGNPDVSFFKDTANNNKFIIVWEEDQGSGLDIYYKIYDETGTLSSGPTIINAVTTGNQTNPTVSAGDYTDSEFSAGWIDANLNDAEAANYTTAGGFVYAKLKNCTAPYICTYVGTSMNPSNNYAVFAYESIDAGTDSNIYVRQSINGVLQGGGETEINAAAEPFNIYPDVQFINNVDFAVTYVREDAGVTYSEVNSSEFTFAPGSTPTLIGDITLTRVNEPSVIGIPYSPNIGASIINNASNQYYLVVWGFEYPTIGEYNTYGQILDYSGVAGNSEFFGPNFMINSTQAVNQYTPDAGYNENGMAIVAWQGETATDTAGVATQLLQNTTVTEAITPVAPTIAQEIITGALTMTVPSTIDFAPIDTSATDSQTQEVSVRDVTYGGDVKYIEVQDSLGNDFTLTVQISDFSIIETGPGGTPQPAATYIFNDQHFRIRNWDQSNTNTDADCITTPPTKCFLTNYSSIVTTNTNLDSSTDSYVYADTQKTLLEKTNAGAELEIGNWRFYPDFEITVPPFTPAGDHTATMTFTLI